MCYKIFDRQEMLIKKITVLAIGLLLWTAGKSFGYLSDYPPYKFKDGPLTHLNVKPLVSGEGDYKSKDGSVVVYLKEPKSYEVKFLLKVDKTILVSSNKDMEWFPSVVFQTDLNNDGHNDFIVIYNSRGPGLGGHQDKVEIYLGKKSGFENISYFTLDAGIEDFIGPGKNGEYRVIKVEFYEGDDRHNYFVYHIFEFRNYRMVNVDKKVKGFPKHIKYTYRNNDSENIQ